MPEILPPVLINNNPNLITPALQQAGNYIGPLFQNGTQGPPGPNTITSLTQSDGTAIISISGLTIGNSLTLNAQNYSYSANSLLAHRTALNIDRLNNTSDAEKPISTATQTALNNKSNVGHTHSASNITDFNAAASAAAPVQSVNTRGGAIVLTKSDVGLGNVDNTSDANKPISSATQTALNNKVDIVVGKGLSDENYTSVEKSKLAGIAAGAEVNVNADWTATSGDSAILNKPTLGTAAAASTSDFATAAQGDLADSALQPESVNYLGTYNNGADYNPGDVVLYAGILYIRVLGANPGYPPGTSYWTEFEPEIGSPAYDLYVQTTLNNKSNVGHSHASSDITDFSSAASAAAPIQSINTRVGDITLSKSDVGLDNVDNTSDANKPISSAAQTALNNKVDVVTGKGLSDENYTLTEKSKLDGIAAGAEVNVNADWSATSGDAQILNKPSTVAGYNITDAVATSGAQHIDGVKTFSSSPLVPNLTVDSSSSAAVNKAYVDNTAAGIHVHAEVHVILKNSTLAAATGGTVAYTNGNDGVGAKLIVTGGTSVVDALNTACGNDPDLTIGGRVIIAGETNAAWNGIYTISATRELTRATDADTPAKMNGGDFVFVTHGTIHADTGWICSEPVTSVGVSPVIFVQFSGSGAYDAGVGLQRDGTLFSVKTPVGGAIVADSNGINLVASGVTPNTYGSSTQSAIVTVNDKGLVTSASSSTITPAVGSITGLGTGVSSALSTTTNTGSGLVTVDGNATLTNKTLVAPNIGAATGTSLSLSGNLTVDTNTLFVDSANNRVGIGTATPGTAKLVIRNDNDSVNWLLQTQNDNGNTNSLFTQNGAGDFVWNGYRNGTSLGSPELALNTNGNSFLNGGNVGIGTASPATKFHVSEGISRFDRSGVVFDITPNYTGLGNVALDVTTNNGIIFRTNNIDRAVISNTGSVGIGTITPTAGYTLDVVGAAKISGNILCNGSILYLNAQQVLTQGTNSLTLGAATYFTTINYGNASTTVHNFAAGKVGIGTTSPGVNLQVTPLVNNSTPLNGSATGAFAITSVDRLYGLYGGVNGSGWSWLQAGRNDSVVFYNLSLQANGGNVGIGTTSPAEKLTVSGNISASGTIITSNYNPASNVATFLATPTSANLAAAVTDETGTGALVFANTPTLVTPNIGAATGASLNITGDLTASGTTNSLPNQTLSVADNTRILTQKTSARDDMWSVWQKRRIPYNLSSAVGTSFSASGGNSGMLYSVACGTSAIGRAGSFGETGMTSNPGQGASWSIPSSFAVSFGFYSLMVNNTLTSNNITSGSTTFTISTSNHAISVGHRIWSSAFPEETYVSAVSGTSVTATQAASSTPTTPHTVVFSPDQIARVVLGTSNLVANYTLECPNARESFNTPVGASIGATSLQINSNIVSTGVVNMWSGQPYFILTTTNASISNANGTTFYAACANFPVSATALSVLRCDNATGTPTTTTGTWTGPGTNQIVVGVANNIIAGQTVSGLGIPQNTTVQSVSGTTITLNQMITSSGSGVALYFGYQRIYVDQNATATATGQGCGFIAKNVLSSYAYGRGITGGTTITNIINGPISGFNLVISNALTKAYVAGVPIAINLANSPTALNNCIFMDFGADPSDGYLKVRLGYMNNGLITYSAWTSFPKGNIISSYNNFFQAVIDYNAATDKLRLFVDRNGDIVTFGNPKDVPKPPSTPTITMTGVSTLNDKFTNIYFGTHIYGNSVNTLATTTIARFDVRQLDYFPFQTFID